MPTRNQPQCEDVRRIPRTAGRQSKIVEHAVFVDILAVQWSYCGPNRHRIEVGDRYGRASSNQPRRPATNAAR
jgi:hypothetical protein